MKSGKIIIRGGKSLSGKVVVAGAKNAALPNLAASLLTNKTCNLTNIPRVEDVQNLSLALKGIGAEYEFNENEFSIQIPNIRCDIVGEKLAKATRASILLLGPLLARHGYAKIAFPGGCTIGERKINYHLEGLMRMGAMIDIERSFITAKASKLYGIEYNFPSKTVTGTENLLMAASLAEGTTVLNNCANEPEVADLANYLVKMGAIIEGIGGDQLVIEGKSSLSGAKHKIIPDRIEAGTYLILGCFPGNTIEIENVRFEHLQALFNTLKKIGFSWNGSENSVIIEKRETLCPIQVRTEPYPGFPTDLQAQLTALLTQVSGDSKVVETIFNDRFKHVGELVKLGARIDVFGDSAIVHGGTPFSGTRITTTDLRASAALVIGGLIAEGETVIGNAFQLMRGYERMPEKLQKLGAEIRILE